MSPVLSILLGLLLLVALFRRGSGGDRRFLGKSALVAVVLILVVVAVLVLM